MHWDMAEDRIHDALVALTGRCEKHSYVIIIEEDSGKFVQFGRGPDLVIDVPCIALTGGEVENASQFFESLGEEYYPNKRYERDEKTGKVTYMLIFNHNFGRDARAASQTAMECFRIIYGLAGAELEIREE